MTHYDVFNGDADGLCSLHQLRLEDPARELATPLGLDAARLTVLRELGENLAYNAYGDSEADLIAHPAALYRTLSRYADPFRLIAEEPLLGRIDAARRRDLSLAR